MKCSYKMAFLAGILLSTACSKRPQNTLSLESDVLWINRGKASEDESRALGRRLFEHLGAGGERAGMGFDAIRQVYKEARASLYDESGNPRNANITKSGRSDVGFGGLIGWVAVTSTDPLATANDRAILARGLDELARRTTEKYDRQAAELMQIFCDFSFRIPAELNAVEPQWRASAFRARLVRS